MRGWVVLVAVLELVLVVLWWWGGEVDVEVAEVLVWLLGAVVCLAVVLCGRWRGEWKGGG